MTDVAGAGLVERLAAAVLEDVEAVARLSDPGAGVSRLAYSNPDSEGRAWFEQRAHALGLRCVIDGVGNAFAFNAAADRQRPILIGSHLDSVLNGGRYDGVLGVLLALAVAGHLAQTAKQLPVAVVSFACEESTRFGFGAIGSRYAVGELEAGQLSTIVDRDGRQLGDVLASAGLRWSQNPRFRIGPDTVRAYLEAHIDQGTLLTSRGSPLGVVTSITGVDRVALQWTGETAHSGARTRAERRDALLGAADFITRNYDLWCELDPDGSLMAATVGRIAALPNSPNTVVGQVDMIADIRSANPALLAAAVDRLKGLAAAVAADRGVSVDVRELGRLEAVPMDASVIDVLLTAAVDHGPRRERVVSLSGHDAMVVGRRVPAGMVLLPNPTGISHAPEESVREESVAEAIQLLLEAVPRLAESNV